MYKIDKEKRQIIVTNNTRKEIIINEFDTLHRIYLPNTKDKYECELVLLDIEMQNELGEGTGKFETRAFGRKKGNPHWLLNFVPEEYEL